MRRMLFLTLFVLAFTVPAFAQDAVKADPKHYKVEFENARVRIVRAKYGPHEKSVMHTHPALVAIFQTDGHVKFTFPDGRTEERETKAGQAMWMPPTKHLPENLDDKDMEVVLVEMKARRRAAPKKPAEPGATTAPTAPPKKN